MKVKHAIALYSVVLVVALIGAWLAAYFIAWWAGMALMTILVIEHAWRVVKRIVDAHT